MMTLDVKSSDDDRGAATVAHLLTSSEGMQSRQSAGCREKTPEEETSGKELEGLLCEGLTLIEICVTFLCAQSRREKWGERETAAQRGKGSMRERRKRKQRRGREIERASRVEFL